jgi:hypothetical protein
MRGRATTVEQTCFGQHERAGARRGYSPGSLQSLAQKFDHAWRQRSNHGAAADHHCVEVPVVERLGRDADAIELRIDPPVSDSRCTS